jgi:hypothetical protein
MTLKSPPPYFPQAIGDEDPNRYLKFKIIVGSVITGFILLLIAGIVGIVYLVRWLAS